MTISVAMRVVARALSAWQPGHRAVLAPHARTAVKCRRPAKVRLAAAGGSARASRQGTGRRHTEGTPAGCTFLRTLSGTVSTLVPLSVAKRRYAKVHSKPHARKPAPGEDQSYFMSTVLFRSQHCSTTINIATRSLNVEQYVLCPPVSNSKALA